MLPGKALLNKAAVLLFFLVFVLKANAQRTTEDFDKGWHFNLGDVNDGEKASLNDAAWRMLNLPHDWSIEGKFSKDNPATPEGGALPGGIGWYRKTFTVPASSKNKLVYIDFDGVYQKSDVWINGHHLGFRPNGYISFRYELTPYLNFGGRNTIAVKVDNSVQPNSRWYSGSGIYRNVWLVTTSKVAVDHWGTFVTTSDVSAQSAMVNLNITLKNSGREQKIEFSNEIYDANGKSIDDYGMSSTKEGTWDTIAHLTQHLKVNNPVLWSVEHPYLYKIVTKIFSGANVADTYTTFFGIRYFNFDPDKGFSLNGKPMKILGVCDPF